MRFVVKIELMNLGNYGCSTMYLHKWQELTMYLFFHKLWSPDWKDKLSNPLLITIEPLNKT